MTNFEIVKKYYKVNEWKENQQTTEKRQYRVKWEE